MPDTDAVVVIVFEDVIVTEAVVDGLDVVIAVTEPV